MTRKPGPFIPLGIFAAFALLMALPLLRGHDPTAIESALIGKPVPATAIEGLVAGDLSKGVTVVNFFASWCLSCQAEQPLLARIARAGIPVYGIAYKDKPGDTQAWLARHGNPFSAVGQDAAGTAAIDWGVYGVPETYVLQNGIVRYRHAGAVSEKIYEDELQPLLKELAP